jgi:methyltransferase (TIGR00027 family)
VRQYVVLGAGFDTFAYRNPFPALRVFEVDHPATQEVKRRRLESAGIAIPSSVTYVPVDFAVMSLSAALADAGFSPSVPSVFAWLGVVPYLELPAIEASLRFAGSLPRGTTIVFDYAAPASTLTWSGRLVFKMMAKRVASIGEPWKTFFDPADLRALLSASGFREVEDYGPAELNERYFRGRADGLRVGGMLHIAKGVV